MLPNIQLVSRSIQVVKWEYRNRIFRGGITYVTDEKLSILVLYRLAGLVWRRVPCEGGGAFSQNRRCPECFRCAALRGCMEADPDHQRADPPHLQ